MKPELKVELENMIDTTWKLALAQQHVPSMVTLIQLTLTVKS